MFKLLSLRKIHFKKLIKRNMYPEIYIRSFNRTNSLILFAIALILINPKNKNDHFIEQIQFLLSKILEKYKSNIIFNEIIVYMWRISRNG